MLNSRWWGGLWGPKKIALKDAGGFHVERLEVGDGEQEELIDRRRFVRRLFAIGAGIAVGGEVLRQFERLSEGQDAFEAMMSFDSSIDSRPMPVTIAQWDALLKETYVTSGIVDAINVATPFTELRRPSRRSPRRDAYYRVYVRGAWS